MAFFVYWIQSERRNYIGATVSPERRLRQHNGCLTGGARRTCGRTWRFRCVILGFRTWREALQFEWAFKRCTRRCRSDATRVSALNSLLARERWTSNSPRACDVPLVVDYRYGEAAGSAPGA